MSNGYLDRAIAWDSQLNDFDELVSLKRLEFESLCENDVSELCSDSISIEDVEYAVLVNRFIKKLSRTSFEVDVDSWDSHSTGQFEEEWAVEAERFEELVAEVEESFPGEEDMMRVNRDVHLWFRSGLRGGWVPYFNVYHDDGPLRFSFITRFDSVIGFELVSARFDTADGEKSAALYGSHTFEGGATYLPTLSDGMALMMLVVQSYCESGLSPAEAIDYAAYEMLGSDVGSVATMRGREYETVRSNIRSAEQKVGVDSGAKYREEFRESLEQAVERGAAYPGSRIAVDGTVADGVKLEEGESYALRVMAARVSGRIGVHVFAPESSVSVGTGGEVAAERNLGRVLEAVREDVSAVMGVDAEDVPFKRADEQRAERLGPADDEVVVVGWFGK